MDYFSFFDKTHQILFALFAFLLISSIALWLKSKERLSLYSLAAATLLLGFTVASLEPYLFLWDEQFHALAAKNLSRHPFTPTLYENPLLPYDKVNWTANHVWLHKPPFFLWQMALSIKIFGTNEMAVRIPSIIMHALFPLLVYRIAFLALNKNAAYISAVLSACSYFFVEIAAGSINTDHNDVAFTFYLTLSFWAWFNYKENPTLKWIYLIGIFAGIAVLNKWLPGLMVFPLWLIISLIQKSFFLEWRNILKAFCAALLVFLPWQIYIFLRFPEESRIGYELMSKHFVTALDGHSGSFFFHFEQINFLYGAGTIISILLPIALVCFFFSAKNKIHKWFFGLTIFFVYLFFSLAKTKMPAFTFIISSLVFILLGNLISFVLDFALKFLKINWLKNLSWALFLLLIAFLYLDLPRIADYHTDWRPQERNNRVNKILEMETIRKIEANYKGNNWVVFNTKITPAGHIPLMFYTDKVSYERLPTEEEISSLQKKKYNILVLNFDTLPGYIRKNKSIQLLDFDSSKILR